ncbi:protein STRICTOSIDINE SYNTHASE-LIKE 2-like [Setaria italica]|uniref:protein STRICTOSIDINE SYNTHASE-LIKE 2-like n=1 Tax=Setaria italica TaxID=4555 RepID=UPI000BE55C50|nr:protein STRICTOSIDINE SYNTHASE-LIKE 2-like [Setaria italica]
MRAEVLVLAVLVAAAAFLSLDSLSDVRRLEIGNGDDVELVPLLDGAAGPESIAFDESGGGPYTSVSDGRVLRWLPEERRWVEHSCSAPELRVAYLSIKKKNKRLYNAGLSDACTRLGSCKGSQDPGRKHECGRPLGLKFNSETGELYVADAYHGLGVVPPRVNDTLKIPMRSDTEAPEGEFLELLEGPSEFEEIVELIPCEASPSDNANIFTDQGKPRCIYTYLLWRVVGPEDHVSRPLLVLPEWQGSRRHRPFSFANGVEIDHETGAIYFTETSTRFQRR